MGCVLGIDAGATKTECVLLDERGDALARTRSGAANPQRVGFERAVAAIVEAMESAVLQAGVERDAVMAACAGVAGAGEMQAKEQIRIGLARAFPEGALTVCSDLDIALAAAGGDGPAIVLIAGTGSAAVGRGIDGVVKRAGGLGAVVGDEGSARDVGRKAIAAARLRRQESGVETALGKQLLRQLGMAGWDEWPGRQGTGAAGGPRENGAAEERGDIDFHPRLFPVVAN